MKRKLFILSFILIAAQFLHAAALEEVIALADDAPLLQAAKAKSQAYEKLYEAQKSLDYPSLDLTYSGTYLKEKPVMYMQSSFPLLPSGSALQIQSQNQYKGSLRLSYALFSGFAVSSLIDKAKYEAKKEALQAQDTKRNLYLGVVALYAKALSFKHLIDSQKITLEATQKSYDKAKAFYELGLIAPSQLYRLEAALNAAKSRLLEVQNAYKVALTQLSTLVGKEITQIQELPPVHAVSLKTLTQEALTKRPDLLALSMMVHKQQSQIALAKSSYYPSVALFAQASQVGDGLDLNGDGFTNKDRSAAGFVVNYNLFNGLKSSNEIQAAQAAKLSAEMMMHSYADKVRSEVKTSYLTYTSLQTEKKALQAQLKAQRSYEKLVLGEFENQMADADKLSRAIAASAMARAALIALNAKLYTAYAQMLLEVDNEHFLQTLKDTNDD